MPAHDYMHARLPRLTGPEVLRALQRGGWLVVRQIGSHAHLKHRDREGRVTVPVHARRTLKLRTMAAILEQAGLTAEEFRQLL